MTAQERFARALQIRAALETLMTTEEADTDMRGCMSFADYISDLNIVLQRSLATSNDHWGRKAPFFMRVCW